VGHRGNPLPPSSEYGVRKIIPPLHPEYATRWLARIHDREEMVGEHPELVLKPLEREVRRVSTEF